MSSQGKCVKKHSHHRSQPDSRNSGSSRLTTSTSSQEQEQEIDTNSSSWSSNAQLHINVAVSYSEDDGDIEESVPWKNVCVLELEEMEETGGERKQGLSDSDVGMPGGQEEEPE